MKLIAAPTKEQGQEFVIVLVRDHVIDNVRLSEEMIEACMRQFGMRAALMGDRQPHRTRGPEDIVRWLRNIAPERLPWNEFSLN